MDVEPIVFWDGASPLPSDELVRGKATSSFQAGPHGEVSVGHNGPSEAGLVAKTLDPLGLDSSCVAFTDAIPWFFVKSGKGSQGEAVATRFAPVAHGMGLNPVRSLVDPPSTGSSASPPLRSAGRDC